MHNSYFFLQRLVPALEQRLAGTTLVSAFSQEKDELVMEFNDGQHQVFIRTVFSPQLSIILFPTSFRRARKNAADVFNAALMGKVTGLELFRNERSFLIRLDNGYGLLFKLHGPSGNVLMVNNHQVTELFRNVLDQDAALDPSALHRELDFSQDFFQSHYPELTKSYFTFGKEIWTWLRMNGFGQVGTNEAWDLLQQAFAEMKSGKFHIIRHQGRIWFSLLPFGEVVESLDDPFTALERFQSLYLREQKTEGLRGELLREAQARWRQTDALVTKYSTRLKEISGDTHFQEWADLIMANLHRLHTGETQMVAESFYSPGLQVTIKLDPSLSPQKNAEVFYRKSRNRNSEVARLEEALAVKQVELAQQQQLISQITDADGMEALARFSDRLPRKPQAQQLEERLPYTEYEHMGYRILVGRSAQDNDELTLRHAAKNDL
ncbi:MAG: NFACT family protein, partial [Bacteroidota bacterium]